MKVNRYCAPGCVVLLLSMLLSLPVAALELGDAKARGLVGETATGYLGVIRSSPDVDALVKNINAQRKAQYQKIADKNKIGLEAVEVRAGQKAMPCSPLRSSITWPLPRTFLCSRCWTGCSTWPHWA